MRIEPKPRIGEFGHVQLADVYHPGRSQLRYARHVGGLRDPSPSSFATQSKADREIVES